MIVRTGLVAAVLLAATPARAAVVIGTQIADTRLAGTIAGAAARSEASDALTRAGRINVQAQLVAPGGGVSGVRAVSVVSADLADAMRGRVTFRRTLTPGADDAIASSAANYRYRFTTDETVAFEVNWGVTTFGGGAGGTADARFPAQSLTLATQAGGDAVLRLDELGDGANGFEQLTLAPGSYELRIADAVAPVALPGSSSGVTSQYSFALRVVPEPATWAMLIVGFGAVGAALRRRRSRALPAA